MKLELTQKLQQQQILAPQMILSMDILLLTAQELEARIEREFTENPALEIEERTREPSAERVAGKDGGKPEEPFAKVSSFESQWSSPGRFEGLRRRARPDSDHDKQEFLQNTAGKPEGLKDYLLRQLHVGRLSREIQDVAEEIIQNLDHRGYLEGSSEEVFTSMDHHCSRERFGEALAAVRRLDPPGVGAQDLRQCLLLQLERDPQEYPLETQIIVRHLEDLGQNRIPKIAKELGASIEEIKEAVEIITRLDPLPGSRYESEPTIYIRPEVIVEKIEGRIEVRLVDGTHPHLQVSETCRQLLKQYRGNKETTQFLRKKIESAQWLISAIHQRQRTLYEIACAIVEFQRDFMEQGPQSLKAMRMQTIADIVGVHISTISRAIKGKYVQTPWGVYEIRHFFTGGVTTSEGEVESRRNVYRRIGEIIESEDKSHPYSDADIARILTEQGLDIARRTVTKYREQERIPSSRLRKQY